MPHYSRFTRRQWLATAALATVAGATTAGEDRFSALRQPAIAVRSPDKAVLLAVARAGERLVAVGERGVIALSDDGARLWRQARSVPTSVTLTTVRFADAKQGWAVGHGGVVLATQDGGEQWTLLADGRSLAALAEEAARGRPELPALAKEAALLVVDGPDKPLLDLLVADARRVFVVGAYNLAFESSDGGRSWRAALDRMDNPKSRHLNALAARGETWLLAGEQGLMMRSRDAGRSFQRLNSPYAGSWFALVATGTNEWIAAGLRGHAYRSTDDGDSWAALLGAPPASFVSAAALPDGGVLLANQAGQVFSSRGGLALAPVPAPALPPLTQVLPLPGGDLIALTLAGIIRMPAKAAT
jgi:photosystem II stability/assembly factor-like uncharacterized protein